MRKRRKTLAALLIPAMLVCLTTFNLSATTAIATNGENELADPAKEEPSTEEISKTDSSSTGDTSTEVYSEETSDPDLTDKKEEKSSNPTETISDPDNDTQEEIKREYEEKEPSKDAENIGEDEAQPPLAVEVPAPAEADAPAALEDLAPSLIADKKVDAPFPGMYFKEWYIPANFYLLNGVDAELPEEPVGHSADGYSSAIFLGDAVNWSPDTFSAVTGDGSKDDLADDGFTANNSVLSSLHHYPSASEIQSVFPSFDPETQYVVWYVKKLCSGSGIHVDGVIRNRTASKQDIDEEEISEDFPNVSIEITTTCEGCDFEYDGKEHVIGGFSIVVRDLDEKKNGFRHLFSALGDLVSIDACAAADGEGTYFSHNGIRYWVNIDAAFVVATEIKAYTIPFIFNGQEISSDQIVVKFEKNGKFVDLPSSIVMPQKPSTTKVNVKQRSITIEAGTTVKNYDGSTITNDNVTITSGSLMEGHRLVNVVINGSQTGIGSSKNEITSYMIVDENGKDVTSLYNVKCVNGKLELVGTGDDTDSDPGDPNTASASYKTTTIAKSMEKNDAEVTVLGATKKLPRMGQTGDNTNIMQRTVIIVICCAVSLLLYAKRERE